MVGLVCAGGDVHRLGHLRRGAPGAGLCVPGQVSLPLRPRDLLCGGERHGRGARGCSRPPPVGHAEPAGHVRNYVYAVAGGGRVRRGGRGDLALRARAGCGPSPGGGPYGDATRHANRRKRLRVAVADHSPAAGPPHQPAGPPYLRPALCVPRVSRGPFLHQGGPERDVPASGSRPD